MQNRWIARAIELEGIATRAQHEYVTTGVVSGLNERDWEDLIDWLLDGGLSTHGHLLEWVEQIVEPQQPADMTF